MFDVVPYIAPVSLLKTPLGELTKVPEVVTPQVMATDALRPNGTLAEAGKAVIFVIAANVGAEFVRQANRNKL